MAASRWDRSRDDRDQTAGRGPRSARSRWQPPGETSIYGEDRDPPATPETGRWSARQDRWIPQPRSTEDTDYRIKRFVEDTGEIAITPQRPGQGQVLDHDEFWSTRRVDPAPPQPGDPYWGAPTPAGEPEVGDPYWGAPQPAPPQPPRLLRRPPAAQQPSAPPMSPVPPPPAPPPPPPRARPAPPRQEPPPPPMRTRPPAEPPPMRTRPYAEPPPMQPTPQRTWPQAEPAPTRNWSQPEPPPPMRSRPQPPPEPVSPPPRFGDYRRATGQTDWRTGEYRWRATDDRFADVPDDDYSDWDAPVDDDDEVELPGPRSYVYAALAALGWFIIPVAIYLGYAFLMNDRAEAVRNLFGNVPLVTITVSVSILIALVLRRVASNWRTLTVGFASAVVGAGAATVLFTVVSG